MSTLTARQPSTPHHPSIPVVVIAFVIVALGVTVAVIVPRVTATSTDTNSSVGTAYAGGGGGSGSHSHPGRGHASLNSAAGATARAAAAAELVVTHQRQYLQQLVDQRTRLIDRGLPRDSFAIAKLDAQVTTAQKALQNALQAEGDPTHRSR
jgi:hypothetical protein